ncbi:hypothetical protein LSAT2_030181 [Lamellibrachia satsuma]|nr:hypothetical protein LSAT2_030181 [Lamellibrachia satsuma]
MPWGVYKPYGQAEISPLTLEMAEGATETLHCTPPGVVGNPPASWFVWTMQNGTFLENTTSPQLTIRPEYVNESRLYWCAAGNYLGQSGASEWANVTVLDASIIRSRNGPLVRGSGIVPLVVGVVLGVVLVICIIAVSLVVWRHRRKSDGAYRSGGTKSAMLGMESMPLQCRSNAGDAIRNHPDASPPKKPPRIYSYEQGGLYKKYFKGLPTPPPTPPALDDCDDNKNVFATTQEDDKQVPKVEIVYAELKHASPSQRDFAPPQPRVIYADLKFNDRPATGN